MSEIKKVMRALETLESRAAVMNSIEKSGHGKTACTKNHGKVKLR